MAHHQGPSGAPPRRGRPMAHHQGPSGAPPPGEAGQWLTTRGRAAHPPGEAGQWLTTRGRAAHPPGEAGQWFTTRGRAAHPPGKASQKKSPANKGPLCLPGAARRRDWGGGTARFFFGLYSLAQGQQAGQTGSSFIHLHTASGGGGLLCQGGWHGDRGNGTHLPMTVSGVPEGLIQES
uniref:Uncharacterized protein n=1 Tax=Paramormyrops kingsleyae TaxID=1676925 RepID=A0A3B3RGS9_9TELE